MDKGRFAYNRRKREIESEERLLSIRDNETRPEPGPLFIASFTCQEI